jgi:hypothetical protein
MNARAHSSYSDQIEALSGVMPALVAGIRVFLAGASASEARMTGTSPAMTA